MTMDNTIEKFTLSKLVAKYPGGIRIPMIQRDYAQGRPSWANSRKRFLDDLKKALCGEKLLHLDFVYGIEQTEGKTDAFCPLDGQQRLTTLFLLHWHLAARDGCFGKFQDTFRIDGRESKFTYQVRPGGRSFFQSLVEHAPQTEECRTTKPTDWIRQQSWFRSIWERDPSVAGALVMLDSIHEHFKETSTDDNPAVGYEQLADGYGITFQSLDLGAAGLHDDLYLRMNARGRPLTTFETFKARFDIFLETNFPGAGKLDRCTVKSAKDFADRIDTVWLDFIWDYYGPEAVKSKNQEKDDTSSVDKALINLFRAVALVSLEPTQEDAQNNITKAGAAAKDSADVTSLSGGEPDYDDFENGGWLTVNFTAHLIHVLESCEPYKKGDHNQDSDFILFHPPWSKEEGTLLSRIVGHEGAPELADYLQFAACIRFFTFHGPVLDGEHRAEFKDWNRVVRNLILNSDVRAETFLDMLSGLDQLMEGCRNGRGILAFLAGAEGKLPGFNEAQTKEERLKARLILADKDGWWSLIEKAEKHRYFLGQIDFLLDFSSAKLPNVDYASVQSNFRRYFDLAEAMFGDDGLRDNPKDNGYLWQRALLAVGDYLLLYSGVRWSLLDDRGRNGPVTWKRFLREDHGAKRGHLKDLWDQVDINSREDSLNAVIRSPIQETWRKALCDTLKGWDYCGDRLIHFVGRGERIPPRVFLLSRTIRSTDYEELHSFCFRNGPEFVQRIEEFLPLKFTGPDYVPSSDHPHLKFEFDYIGKNVFQLYCNCHEDSGFSLRISRQGSNPDLIDFLLTDQVGFELETNPWWLGEHFVKRSDLAEPFQGAALLKSIADALKLLPIQESS